METSSDQNRGRAAVLDSMVLLSTLHTALGVRYDLAERQAGRDPSGQEAPEDARMHLREDRLELSALAMRLRMSSIHAAAGEEDEMAASIRHFDDLLALNQAARVLRSIHQRLLSLYPAAPEWLIEEARLLHTAARELTEATEEDFKTALNPFLDRAFTTSTTLAEELLK